MTEKSEALRLAEQLEKVWFQHEAAAELRRLHEGNKLLRQRHYDDNVEYTRVLAQRDALLEACKAYDKWADKTFCYDRELRPIRAQIRAAIKAVEEGK